MRTPTEHAESGRALVRASQLMRLRTRLGLTRSAMAELLHISPVTYNRCEDLPHTADRMWTATAERLGRFSYLTELTLAELRSENISLSDMMPLHTVANMYGIPQEVLLNWHRTGVIECEDLGILGLWLHKDDLHQLDHDIVARS